MYLWAPDRSLRRSVLSMDLRYTAMPPRLEISQTITYTLVAHKPFHSPCVPLCLLPMCPDKTGLKGDKTQCRSILSSLGTWKRQAGNSNRLVQLANSLHGWSHRSVSGSDPRASDIEAYYFAPIRKSFSQSAELDLLPRGCTSSPRRAKQLQRAENSKTTASAPPVRLWAPFGFHSIGCPVVTRRQRSIHRLAEHT